MGMRGEEGHLERGISVSSLSAANVSGSSQEVRSNPDKGIR